MIEYTKFIKDISNPKKFRNPLNVSGYENDFLLEILERMILIRTSEEKLAKERERGTIGGPVHLSAGQEAMAVGVCKNLTNKDRVFGAHRSHSHLLSLNPDPYRLFAEVLGKETGFSKGMGGSMHLFDRKSGFYGSVPIVSGTVPLAVGAGFDAYRLGKNYVGVAFIGDGATEEGIVHESLNLAKVLPSPTIFVIENNLFSSHLHISLRQPNISTARFAEANHIDFEIVDGNNILEVYESSKRLLKISRKEVKPIYLEGFTFRHYGHVDWRKDIDVGLDRSQKQLKGWLLRDPIRRLFLGMKEANVLTKKDFENLSKILKNEIDNAWKKALKDPYPSKDKLLSRVYSE